MIDVNDLTKTVCEIADEVTSQERQKEYGHPVDNFRDIARMWSVILNVEVTPEQVCLCNIATKICRQKFLPKRDNLVDAAGYAKCIDIIRQYEKEESNSKEGETGGESPEEENCTEEEASQEKSNKGSSKTSQGWSLNRSPQGWGLRSKSTSIFGDLL